MSEKKQKQIEKEIKSELEPFLDGVRTRRATYLMFKQAYVDFQRIHEHGRIIRKHISTGLFRKTHDVKDAIQWIFLYLGFTETLGNSLVNMLVMLLVANGRMFHIESRFSRPRIKHAMSIEDLENARVPLREKLNFLNDNGLKAFDSIVDSQLRNDIAHLKNIKVTEDEILIRGKPARRLLLDSTVKLLRAFNVTRELLEQLAKEKGVIKEEEMSHE